MAKIVYITDLAYEAKGRDYSKEDIYITNLLRKHFDVALAHPQSVEAFEDNADLLVFRNTGGVLGFKDVYTAFLQRIKQKGLRTFNTFTGKADMQGKQYLIDLFQEGYPVIPTIDTLEDLDKLPDVDSYVIKPKDGADSIGMEMLSRNALLARTFDDGEMLIQPKIDFEYEVSFYFINHTFEYALYAPDTSKRWELEMFVPSQRDIDFANTFIQWNSIKSGIQRVDVCRTKDGALLLVELEDLNPYLSLELVDEATRNAFMNDFIDALHSALKQ